MARQFDAASEEVDLGYIAALDAPSSFWVSAWVRMDALTQDGFVLTSFDGSDGWALSFDDVNPGGNDRLDFIVEPGGERVSSSAEVPVDEWHHWLAQYDATADELRLYKDGVLDDTTSSVTSDPGSSAANIIIGNTAE